MVVGRRRQDKPHHSGAGQPATRNLRRLLGQWGGRQDAVPWMLRSLGRWYDVASGRAVSDRYMDIAPNLTSQPMTKFYFRDGDREIATSAYGLMAPGTKLSVSFRGDGLPQTRFDG